MANAQDGFDRASLVKYQSVTREYNTLVVKMAHLLTTRRPHNSPIQHGILILSMLRVARSGEAQLLLSEGLYSEEMHCVNRALAEISINAAYLQIAVEAEIHDYLRYDTSATARVVQKMITSMPKEYRPDRAEELRIRQLLTQLTSAQSTSGSRAMPSWTSKNITLRAREVDKAIGFDLMTMLLMVYEVGHSHVHGTAFSVVPVGDWIQDGANPNDPTRLEGTMVALSFTTFCLNSLAVFAGQRYQLGLDSEIERLRETLNRIGLE